MTQKRSQFKNVSGSEAPTPKSIDLKQGSIVFGNPARILSPSNNARKQMKKSLFHPQQALSNKNATLKLEDNEYDQDEYEKVEYKEIAKKDVKKKTSGKNLTGSTLPTIK